MNLLLDFTLGFVLFCKVLMFEVTEEASDPRPSL
jgi:hypothetical protein